MTQTLAPLENPESDATLNNDLECNLEVQEQAELPPEVLRLIFE